MFFFFIFNFFYPYFTSSKKERKNIKSFFTVILTLWWNNNIPVLAQTPSCVKVKSIFCCQWFTVIMAAAMLWWHTHTSVTSQSQRAGRRRLQRHEGRCWNMDEDIKVETLWDSGTGLTVYREKRQKAKGLFLQMETPWISVCLRFWRSLRSCVIAFGREEKFTFKKAFRLLGDMLCWNVVSFLLQFYQMCFWCFVSEKASHLRG